MAWSTKFKNLSVTNKVLHAPPIPLGGSISLGTQTVQFGPFALFGAAAGCSHLSFVDPALATSERRIKQTLIEQHVNDVNPDSAIAAPGPRLKDFVGTYFTGSVAAEIVYLVMIDDGCLWADHFEKFAPGTAQKQHPDFVFEKQSQVALFESKGSRSGTVGGFNRTVQDGYKLQVEPHLGQVVGGRTASFGACIGTFIKSPMKAEVLQSGLPVCGGSAGGGGSASDDTPNPAVDDGSALSPIQRGNCATVFALCHSADLGFRFRRGVLPDDVEFDRLFWQGHWWLTAPPSVEPSNESLERPLLRSSELTTFAIAEDLAYRTLAAVSAGRYGAPPIFVSEMDLVLYREEIFLEGDEGAIFPEGMAVISAEVLFQSRERLRVRLGPEMAWEMGKRGVTSFSNNQNDVFDQQTYVSLSLD